MTKQEIIYIHTRSNENGKETKCGVPLSEVTYNNRPVKVGDVTCPECLGFTKLSAHDFNERHYITQLKFMARMVIKTRNNTITPNETAMLKKTRQKIRDLHTKVKHLTTNMTDLNQALHQIELNAKRKQLALLLTALDSDQFTSGQCADLLRAIDGLEYRIKIIGDYPQEALDRLKELTP